MGEDYRRETLLHEVVHCCLRAADCNPDRDAKAGVEDIEERTVAALIGPLLGVLRDHPELVAWLTAERQEREIMPVESVSQGDDLGRVIESICPSSLAGHLDPTRLYDGQPHTDYGTRGAQEVCGITMRDVRDAFIRACYESSGLPIEQWPGSVYDLPWHDMDIIAVGQNLSCNIEKAMGIYPNIPRLYPVDPTVPHWCGWPIDVAVWRAHDGSCDTAP